MSLNCPLCGSGKRGKSVFGFTRFRGKAFHFVQCQDCGSHFYDPMPDGPVLGVMYGPEYVNQFNDEPEIPDPKRPEWPAETLRLHSAKTFLDYGCGTGTVMK